MIISRYVDAWHVMNVAVDPITRRRGIADDVVQSAVRVHRRRHAPRLTTRGARVDDGAIKLYEASGFRARGVRRGYYTDNREDALIMWRDPEAGQAESAGG